MAADRPATTGRVPSRGSWERRGGWGPTVGGRGEGRPVAVRTRARLRSVTAMAVLAAVVAAVLVTVPRHAAFVPGMQLTAGSDFAMSGTLSGLIPGTSQELRITATNDVDATLTVTSVTAKLTGVTPSTCPVTKLTVGGTTFTALTQAVTTSTEVDVALGPDTGSTRTKQVWAPTAVLARTAPNTCQSATFDFAYSGVSTYTDSTSVVLSTTTTSPIEAGQSVTLTATVTATNAAEDSSLPHTFAARVDFYECGSGSSCTLIGTAAFTSGTTTATFSEKLMTAGTYVFEARYPGYTTDFSESPYSNTLSFLVKPGTDCVSIATTSATVVTGTHAQPPAPGSYSVAAGETVWLKTATIMGPVNVAAGGKLLADGSTIDGPLVSAGTVELLGTTVRGPITSTGALSVQSGSAVMGPLSASGSGPVCLVGTSASRVPVQGPVLVQGTTSGTLNSFCGLSVQGNLIYQDNGSPAEIGGESDCAGNVIGGDLVVEGNSAHLVIGSGTATGPVTTTTLHAVVVTDPGHAYAAGSAGTILSYGPTPPPPVAPPPLLAPPPPPPANSWTAEPSGTAVTLDALSVLDPQHEWAAGSDCTLLFSSNGGATWTRDTEVPSTCTSTGTDLTGISVSDPSHGWAVGAGGTVLVCTRGCNQPQASWAKLSAGTNQKAVVPSSNVDFTGVWGRGNTVYAVGTTTTTGTGVIWACSANCAVGVAGPAGSAPHPPPAVAIWTNVTPPATVLPVGTALDAVSSTGPTTVVVGASGTILVCTPAPPGPPPAGSCTASSKGWARVSGADAPTSGTFTAVSVSGANSVLATTATGAIWGCSQSCNAPVATGTATPPPLPPPPPPSAGRGAVWAEVTVGAAALDGVGSAGGPAGPAWAVGAGGIMLFCSQSCDRTGASWTTYAQEITNTEGNVVSGSITVRSNTRTGTTGTPSTLAGNYADGSCTLSANTPAIHGSGNAARGPDSCNGTA